MTFQTKLMSNFTASVGPVHMSTGTRFYLKTENSLLFTVLKTIISSALTVLESAFACLHVSKFVFELAYFVYGLT